MVTATAVVMVVMMAAVMVMMSVVVPVMVMAASAPVVVVVVPVVIVRPVNFQPVELMLLVLEEQGRIALLHRHLGQDLDNLDQAVRVKRSIVLLAMPQRSSLPIRHLFTFAHFLIQQMLGDLGKT